LQAFDKLNSDAEDEKKDVAFDSSEGENNIRFFPRLHVCSRAPERLMLFVFR
jgi:hypothetical protein